MPERERREEELRRQRAELAAKKVSNNGDLRYCHFMLLPNFVQGLVQLDRDIEQSIQHEVYKSLEEELLKLVTIEESVHSSGLLLYHLKCYQLYSLISSRTKIIEEAA